MLLNQIPSDVFQKYMHQRDIGEFLIIYIVILVIYNGNILAYLKMTKLIVWMCWYWKSP